MAVLAVTVPTAWHARPAAETARGLGVDPGSVFLVAARLANVKPGDAAAVQFGPPQVPGRRVPGTRLAGVPRRVTRPARGGRLPGA